MKIKIKYHADTEKLKKIEVGDWIDLRAAMDYRLKEGEFQLISLGVSMRLPEGYEAVMVPRSSLFKNYGILQANGMAVIDESYCGDGDIWRFPAYCAKGKHWSGFYYYSEIKKGERICQFRIQKKMPEIDFEEVSDLGWPDRGGFGSTGK